MKKILSGVIRKLYPYIMRFCFRGIGSNSFIKKPILITPGNVIMGKNVFIRDHSRIEGVSRYLNREFNPLIVINDEVTIEQNLHLTCGNSIKIGKNTAIAANVTITDINHPYKDPSMSPERQAIEVGKVEIGEDCKIYNNVTILPNVILGKHCVVGANSVVVSGIYPDFSIIVGSPARIIKRYDFGKNEWVRTNKSGEFIN